MHFYESVLDLPIYFLDRAYNDYICWLNEVDPAHNELHIMHTCMNASSIINRFNKVDSDFFVTPLNQMKILIAAYLHDIGNVINRDDHHNIGAVMGANYLSNEDIMVALVSSDIFTQHIQSLIDTRYTTEDKINELIDEVYSEFIEGVKLCIVEHRASFKGERSNIFTRIVAIADRGEPNIDVYFWRSYLYARTKLKSNHSDAVKHSYTHIAKDKFSPNGHGWKDGELELFYPEKSKEVKKIFEDITFEEYVEYVETKKWDEKIIRDYH